MASVLLPAALDFLSDPINAIDLMININSITGNRPFRRPTCSDLWDRTNLNCR